MFNKHSEEGLEERKKAEDNLKKIADELQSASGNQSQVRTMTASVLRRNTLYIVGSAQVSSCFGPYFHFTFSLSPLGDLIFREIPCKCEA